MTRLPDGIPRNYGSIPEWGRNVFVLHSSVHDAPWLDDWYTTFRAGMSVSSAKIGCPVSNTSSQRSFPESRGLFWGLTKRRILWVLVALHSAEGQVARACSWTRTIQYQSWECMEPWLHFNLYIHIGPKGKFTFYLWRREALYFFRIETRVRPGNRGIVVRFLEGQYIFLFFRPSRTFLQLTQHLI
jgi:hypothetical protein